MIAEKVLRRAQRNASGPAKITAKQKRHKPGPDAYRPPRGRKYNPSDAEVQEAFRRRTPREFAGDTAKAGRNVATAAGRAVNAAAPQGGTRVSRGFGKLVTALAAAVIVLEVGSTVTGQYFTLDLLKPSRPAPPDYKPLYGAPTSSTPGAPSPAVQPASPATLNPPQHAPVGAVA